MSIFAQEQACTVSFSDFMQQALYHPEHGYYRQNAIRQGYTGDYITAPTMGPLFAHCLAHNIAPILASQPHWSIAEIGPGSGALASALLSRLAETTHLPQRYYLLEQSPNQQTLQQQQLHAQLPRTLRSCLQWQSTLPQDFEGIVIANEILDALPVHLFKTNADCQLFELWVERNAASPDLHFIAQPATLAQQQLFKERNIPLFPDYRYEISTAIADFLIHLSRCLSAGLCLFFDYGYARRQYYHPQRSQGTLTSFYQHQHSQDILQHPGLQDISAHVDFTYVAESAHASGLDVHGFTNQEQFLLASQIMPFLHQQQSCVSEAAFLRLRHYAHQLTSPHEMGDIIKVMALTKALEKPPSLPGFSYGSLGL